MQYSKAKREEGTGVPNSGKYIMGQKSRTKSAVGLSQFSIKQASNQKSYVFLILKKLDIKINNFFI